MIVAASTLPYRNRENSNFPEQIACAKRDGFEACELHACLRGRDLRREDVDAIRKGGMPCSVHANYADNNLSSGNESVRQAGVAQIMADILFAETIGSGLLVVHPGGHDGVNEAEAYEALSRSLEELLPFSGAHRVTLALENMDGSGNKLCSSYRDVERVLAAHSGLKLTVDFAHIGMTHQDILPFLDDFAEWIGHFHISGYDGNRPHTEISLRESQIDFKPFLSRIKQRDLLIAIEMADRRKAMESRGLMEAVFGRGSRSE